MSRSRMTFASRTAFEGLPIEGDDEADELTGEAEADWSSPISQDVKSPHSEPPPASLSKKAAKRAAQAAAKASSPVQDTPASPAPPSTTASHPLPATSVVAAPDVAAKPATNGIAPAGADDMKLPEVDELLAPPPPENRPVIYDVPEPPSPPPPAPPPKTPVPAPVEEVEKKEDHRPAPLTLSHLPKTNGVVAHQIAASPRALSPVSARRSRMNSEREEVASPRRSDSQSPSGTNGKHVRTSSSPAPHTRAQALGHAHTPSHLRVSQRVRDVVNSPKNSERAKKFRSVIVRTMATLIMLAVFFLIMAGGTPFVVMLVLVCQALVYREVTALFELSAQGGGPPIEGKGATKSDDRWSKTLNWYFFAVTNYFLYGESLIHYFKHVVFADAWLTPFATNHRFISFMLYMIGFVGFVSNLKRQFLRQQFGLFCWVHMTLFLIVVSSHFVVNNILEGLIWFWVPACLVICNDIFAYVWGMSFGRTPLIQLSPKKTVEGFVGAFFTTILFAYILGSFSMKFNYMVCPGHDLGVTAWDAVECEKNPVFIWRDLPIGEPLVTILSAWHREPVTSVPYAPFQFHSVVLACFASLVAPFGGFFASGFKRAFDIKDFGDSIPGHGGMTDRMDCQFLMGMFTYVYYSTLIRVNHVTPGSILQTIVSSLGPQEQLELYRELTSYLYGRGLISSS